MGRRRGTSAFPVARIKKMMQSDDDVGKIATVTPVLVAKALECMMEHVLREAAAVAHQRRTKTVTPQHLKFCVLNNDAFDFLRATLADIPSLDDADQPPPRKQRSRASAVALPKRTRSPALAAPQNTTPVPKRARLPDLAPPPKIVDTPAAAEPPPDDEDYDDDDAHSDSNDADDSNLMSDAPTSLPLPPLAQQPNDADEGKTAERVSVHALLS